VASYSKKQAPRHFAIFDALEAAGWPEGVYVPVPEDSIPTLHRTLYQINKKLKDAPFRLHAGGDGRSVCWRMKEK
jgi:hypothetical protein